MISFDLGVVSGMLVVLFIVLLGMLSSGVVGIFGDVGVSMLGVVFVLVGVSGG